MSRYRVCITATFDADEVPGYDPLDERTAGQQLEGITTALFLRHIDAWQHLRVTIHEHSQAHDGLQRFVTRKRGLGGWE